MKAMGRVILASVSLAAAPASASDPVLSARSVLTLGVTDNVTETTLGGADIYLEHKHEAAFALGHGDVGLRGTFGATVRQHRRVPLADDWQGSAGLIVERVLQGWELRGAVGIEHGLEGSHVAVAGLAIPVIAGKTVFEAGGELVLKGEGRRTTLTLEASRIANGDARFPSLGIAPLRLAADLGVLSAGLTHEQAISERLVLTAAAEGRLVDVSAQDTAEFNRAGLAVLGLRAGFEAQPAAGWSLSGEVGAWLLHTQADAARPLPLVPYLRVEVGVPLPGGLNLEAGVEMDVDTLDPLDGVADRETEALVRLSYPIAAAQAFMEVGAALSAGIAQPLAFERRRRLAAGITAGLGASAQLRVEASRSWVETIDERYRRDLISVSLTGGT